MRSNSFQSSNKRDPSKKLLKYIDHIAQCKHRIEINYAIHETQDTGNTRRMKRKKIHETNNATQKTSYMKCGMSEAQNKSRNHSVKDKNRSIKASYVTFAFFRQLRSYF